MASQRPVREFLIDYLPGVLEGNVTNRERLLKIPDLNLILRHGRGTSWEDGTRILYFSDSQNIHPVDPDLNEKLGIERSTILFFAGGSGEVAQALASAGNRVHYTDISESITDHAKEKGTGVTSFSLRDAALGPEHPFQYDWSASFEPVPLHRGTLPFALMGALLNNRGAFLIYHEVRKWNPLPDLSLMERLYGTTVDSKKIMLSCQLPGLSAPHLVQNTVYTLRTNDDARRKALVDRAILKEFSSEKGPTTRGINFTQLLAKPTVREINVSEVELRASLDRLDELGRYLSASSLRNLTMGVNIEI
ncbi:MAG: hypothetical protein V1744_01150 [Candidatus Altiarchaeota archaeon]